MQNLIEWAAANERYAAEFYALAVKQFAGESDVCALFMALAADEEDHFQLLDQMPQPPEASYGIALDPVLEADITGVMLQTYEQLKKGALSLRQMLQMVVRFEFAETNSLFLHLVANETGQTLIERHQQRIEDFVHQRPDLNLAPIHINPQPKWPCRILLVEPEPAFATLLAHRLSQLAWLTTVPDASAAFRELQHHSFDILLVETGDSHEVAKIVDAVRQPDRSHPRNMIYYGQKPPTPLAKTSQDPIFLPKPIQMFRLLQAIEALLIDARFSRA